MSSMIKNCPHNDYPSLCSRCSIERHAGSHRKLLNDIEQARVESAEQVVVEGLRAKGLIDNEPPAPRAGERERVILNSDLVVRPMPNTLLKTKYLLATDDDWPVAEFYREEEAEGIAYEHNQHATLIEQRDRLFTAAKFLLAMNATNYDRDAMRSEGGFDALQKAVDYAIEQSRNSATTIEQEGV